MINTHNYGAHENLRELKSEFNSNYKKYLEMSLLQSLVENGVQRSAADVKLDEKLKEKYLKSSLITGYINNSSGGSATSGMAKDGVMDEVSMNDFKAAPLDLEAKSCLVERIKDLLESRLAKVSSFIAGTL